MIINTTTNNNTYNSLQKKTIPKKISQNKTLTRKTLPVRHYFCKSVDLFLYDTNFYRKAVSNILQQYFIL